MTVYYKNKRTDREELDVTLSNSDKFGVIGIVIDPVSGKKMDVEGRVSYETEDGVKIKLQPKGKHSLMDAAVAAYCSNLEYYKIEDKNV